MQAVVRSTSPVKGTEQSCFNPRKLVGYITGEDLIRFEKLKDYLLGSLNTEFETPACWGGPMKRSQNATTSSSSKVDN